MDGLAERAFQKRMQRIEPLLGEIEAWPDAAARDCALECVQTILDLHGAGLNRVLELVTAQGGAGSAVVLALAQDELVGSLLLLHGLHPLELETRVRQALDKVRPYLKTHQGNVELLSVTEGVVRLRLEGSCHGCPSSAQTLKHAIEETLQQFAPDIEGLEVEGVVEAPPAGPANFVPIEQLLQRRPAGTNYTVCPVPAGELAR